MFGLLLLVREEFPMVFGRAVYSLNGIGQNELVLLRFSARHIGGIF